MGSWGHSIRVLKQEECKHIWVGSNGSSLDKCAAPKCQNKPEFIASYNYITGKAGRVSKAERALCRKHAHKYAIKYHLTLPSL